MKTVQRLTAYDSLSKLLDTSTLIEVSDLDTFSLWEATNGTIVFTGEDYYVSSHYVMEVSPSTGRNPTPFEPIGNPGLPVVVTLDVNAVFNAEDNESDFVFSCAVFCAQKSVTIEAKLYDALDNSVVGNTRTIQAGVWTGIRSNVFNKATVSGTRQYKVVLTISGHYSNKIRISTTNLVNDSAWAANPVIQSIRPYIPGFYESYDMNETDPQYPFFRYLDVLTDTIADTMFLYSEWFQFDRNEIIPGFTKADLSTRSRLTNYKAVYDDNVAWLSQFSGSKLKKQVYANGLPVVTENARFQEAQLYPAIYGRNAGTQLALREAASFALTGTQTAVIGQHVNGDPWVIRVITLAEETPNVDVRTDVRVATTGPITIATALNAGDTIDDIVLANGDRVLVKNQSTASQNGVYIVSASPSRATDFDTSLEVTTGATFIVSEGTVNDKKVFQLTTTGTITVGSTALTFGEFGGSPEVLAAIEPARPLGYAVVHQITSGFTLTLGDLEFGILGTAIL